MSNRPDLKKSPHIPKLDIQGYERYLPSAFDESLSILQKINKVIKQLNDIGIIANDLVTKWNELMAWIIGNGLTDVVSDEIDKRIEDGTFDNLIFKIVGDISLLETLDKDNLVDAINEINRLVIENELNIGDMDELKTIARDSLVDAINEIKATNDSNNLVTITIGESTGSGIISGFRVRQQPVLAMAVEVGDSVTENIVHLPDGKRFTVESIAVPVLESDSTLNRKDIVYVNSNGIISYQPGQLSQTPVALPLPVNSVLLAEITVLANDTTINNSDITDKRQMKSLSELATANKTNLVQSINELDKNIKTNEINQQNKNNTINQKIDDVNASLTQGLADATDNLNQTIVDVETGLTQDIANINQSLTQQINDASDSLTTSINEKTDMLNGRVDDVQADVDTLNSDYQNSKTRLIVSETQPNNQKENDVWFEVGKEFDFEGGGGISIEGAVVQENEPENKNALWFQS